MKRRGFITSIGVAIIALALLGWSCGAQADAREDCEAEMDRDVKACSELIRRNPSDVSAYFNRGLGYLYGEKKYQLALRDFSKAIQLNPQNAEYYAYRGFIYSGRGFSDVVNFDKALVDLNKAIELGAKSADIFEARCRSFIAKLDHENAMQDCRTAMDLDPVHGAGAVDLRTAALLPPKEAFQGESKEIKCRVEADLMGTKILLTNSLTEPIDAETAVRWTATYAKAVANAETTRSGAIFVTSPVAPGKDLQKGYASGPALRSCKAYALVRPAMNPEFQVFFDAESAQITNVGMQILDLVAGELGQGYFRRIIVSGHTDASESFVLSKARADAVLAALRAKGVTQTNIEVVASGSEIPLVKAGPGQREAKNRRVQIMLKK